MNRVFEGFKKLLKKVDKLREDIESWYEERVECNVVRFDEKEDVMDVEEMDVLLVKLLMGEFCYFFVFKKVFGMYVLYGVFILYI